MWHKLLRDARFHLSLLEADREIARAARSQGCPACGGRLHGAAFARKPRSGVALPAERAAMSDNGGAMTAAEIVEGLTRLGRSILPPLQDLSWRNSIKE